MKNNIEKTNYEGWSFDDLSKKSRDDHQDIVKELDKRDNALCLVVIGGIVFLTAILFLILSFKRVKNKMSGIDPTSLQFFVCIACFIAGAVLLTVGLVRTIKTVIRRKELKEDIILIAKLKDAIMNEAI